MKITNEILKRIIKEEMDSTLKELVSGPGDFNNEPEISQAKWLALGDLLGLGRAMVGGSIRNSLPRHIEKHQ